MSYRRFLYPFKDAFILFFERNGLQLAAASAFYGVISAVPLFLLLARLVGFFIGDVNEVQKLIFTLGQEVFPEVEPEVLLKVKNIVKGPLLGAASFTFINFIILSMSSLSFFNSIWSGLFRLSGDKSLVSWWKHAKAMLLIGVTVLLVLLVFSVQPALTLVLKLVNHNMVMDAVYSNLPSLRSIIDTFRALEVDSFSFFRSTFTQAILFWVYFALVYRWFFNWRLKKREAFLASGTFVFLLLLGKTLFGLYFKYLRVRLVASYGDFYTLLVGALWIYILMAFFFFGVALVVKLIENSPWNPKAVGANDGSSIEPQALESLPEDEG